MQAAGSVSRVRLVAEIAGKGSAECELVRHLAPLTTSALLKGLPVQDRVHRLEDKFVYIETGLVIGAEKAKTQFKRGDLAFLPSNGAICFVIRDCATQAMNAIGKIVNNIEVIEGVQTGDVIAVKRLATITT
ncbi:cyclophilin-like fold protein [Nitrososphaera viennensis]|uniref:cyclophilin-like fold protein n=1 Tax=Nitrososphaera viennensis TaxID=1034015 RepID=UPI00130DFB46|nr:cyclophilin-like fold protein [Nitrososphaera viennensis]